MRYSFSFFCFTWPGLEFFLATILTFAIINTINVAILRYLLLLSLCLLSMLVRAQKKNSSHQLHIQKASSAIHVDGEMNELAWQDADAADNFFMVFPMDTSHAKVKTSVRMTYDAQNIYIIAICYLTKAGPYMVESLRRDFAFVKNDN